MRFIGYACAVLAFLSAMPAPTLGENYALLVAVGDYDRKELRPLKFTRADVLDFQKALIDSGFAPKNVVVMHDDFEKLVGHYRQLGPEYKAKDYLPAGANIRKELELMLGRLRADDSVVVAFAGHGVQFKGEKKSYFCPADATLERKDTLIPFEEVFAALKESSAGRKLLLVDACQNDPQSEISRSRSTVDLDSITRPQSEPVPEGIIALFSCKAGQKSFELPELGHGLFFYHLLDGWNGKGDLNGDGKVSYQELASYTERNTSEFAALKLKVLQTPQLRAEFSGEWVLRELKTLLPKPFDATRPRTAAEAKASQKEWAKHLGHDVAMLENTAGMDLMVVPPGEFLQGSTAAQTDDILRTWGDTRREWVSNENPQHRVRITKPLLFARTEVTFAQWRRVMKDDPKGTLGAEDEPVVSVTWDDATEFCRKLSEREGVTYRLPTESEWEFACRAGTTTLYHFGENPADLSRYGWFKDNSGNHPHDVALKLPNAFGLHDMLGNVTEWCSDRYTHSFYATSPTDDPAGAAEGKHRSARGGTVVGAVQYCRSASRTGFPADSRFSDLGFRVVAEPKARR